MSKTNYTQAHDFYYKGVDRGITKYYKGCSLNYDGFEAISYSTVVARVIPRKGFKLEDVKTSKPESGLTLISFDSLSHTTGKHLSYLRRASPFECVGIPIHMIGYWDSRALPCMFRDELKACQDSFNRKEYRVRFAMLADCCKQIMDKACDEWAKPLKEDKELQKLLKTDVESIRKELVERNRREAAKAAKETKEALKKYAGDRHGADYCEFLRALFDTWYTSEKYPMDDKIRAVLKKNFDQTGAYVWPVGDEVWTSRGVRVPLQEARVALKLWASGKDMRAYKVGPFSVVRYEGNIIKIGCHEIPRENMLELYEAVVGKPFPKKPELVEAQ